MKFSPLSLEGLVLIEPNVKADARGYFFESYHRLRFETAGLDLHFVQDNESCSAKGTLRGLHYQLPPFEQGKLVRVSKGAAIDVMVDIRKNSMTFGKHCKVLLDDVSRNILWIPPGFAHGFVSLSDNTLFLYKCTNYYNQASERGIAWNDPELNIEWEIETPLVSEKDRNLPTLKDIELVF
jgi:dTDP-4-dehydrorhamnose 3,5-epimerase